MTPYQEPIEPIRPLKTTSNEKVGKTRPQGSPKTDKDFNKILDQDPDQTHTDELMTESEMPKTPSSVFILSARQVKSSAPPLANPFMTAYEEESPVPMTTQNQPNLNQSALNIPTQDPQMENKKFNIQESIPNPKHLAMQDHPFISTKKTDLPVDTTNPLKLPTPEGLLKQTQTQQPFVKEEIEKTGLLNRQLKEPYRPDGLSLETDSTVPSSKTQKNKLHAQSRRLDEQENHDLASINPGFSPITFNPDEVNRQETIAPSRTISQIVEQIVKEMRVLQQGDRTTTIVTLQHPPLLNGAQITLSTLDSAKRSLDIAFINLSGAAKQFLDNHVYKESLVLSLEQKGYAVHALVTSTLTEIPSFSAEAQRFTRGDGGHARQQQQQQQQQQEEREEA
jgi:hypothetical protein